MATNARKKRTTAVKRTKRTKERGAHGAHMQLTFFPRRDVNLHDGRTRDDVEAELELARVLLQAGLNGEPANPSLLLLSLTGPNATTSPKATHSRSALRNPPV